jgi:hypothetical protein
MRDGYRFVGMCLLSAAIVMPAAVRSVARPQNDQGRGRGHDDRGQDNRRAYDPIHRDWHDWDDREEGAYRRYLEENRRPYRSFFDIDVRTQSEYWNWRHAHPEVGVQLRYYDERGRDWHDWDDNENRAYRRFLEENRRPFVEFSVADRGLQLEYWNWRHTHPNIDDRDAVRYRDDHDADYHHWNADEDRAYRRWLAENHRPFIEFSIGGGDLQAQYWAWRHTHPDYRTFYDPVGRIQVLWDDNEDRAYRRYLGERRRAYVDITVLNNRDQRDYWRWRHGHPDRR